MGGAAVCDATAGGWRLISVGHQLRTAARWARASLLLPAAYALVVAGMVLTGWGTVSWVLTPGFAAAPLAPLAPLSVAPASAAGLALTERDAYVVGGEPKDLLQDREEGRLYVSDFRRGEVAVVDRGRGLVEKRLSAPDRPAGLALSADGSSLYIAGYGADEGGELLDQIALEGKPRDVIAGPGGERAYVTLHSGAAVAVVDLEGGGLVETIPVGGRPGALIPYAEDGTAGEEEGDGEGTTLAVAKQRDGTISLLSAGGPVPRFADLEAGSAVGVAARVLSLRGTVSGYIRPEGGREFRPEENLARAQVAKILVEVLGLH